MGFTALLTATVRIAVGNDGRSNRGTASLVGAIAKTVRKVYVLAKAVSRGRGATKGISLIEHAADAGLLEKSVKDSRRA